MKKLLIAKQEARQVILVARDFEHLLCIMYVRSYEVVNVLQTACACCKQFSECGFGVRFSSQFCKVF